VATITLAECGPTPRITSLALTKEDGADGVADGRLPPHLLRRIPTGRARRNEVGTEARRRGGVPAFRSGATPMDLGTERRNEAGLRPAPQGFLRHCSAVQWGREAGVQRPPAEGAAEGPLMRHWRSVGLVIPRQGAPLQSLPPFHQDFSGSGPIPPVCGGRGPAARARRGFCPGARC
jgi:hypothetical protein